ncbi:MAG: TIGR04086 family membrane protein [Deltaproteobacteria bacterium]
MDKIPGIEVKGLSRGLLVSIILTLATAIIVYYSGIKETTLPLIGNIILLVSVFWAGCYVSRQYGSKGLVRGITMGLIFFVLMLIATYIFNPSLIGFAAFMQSLAVCIISGALGGIVGIGLSDKAL